MDNVALIELTERKLELKIVQTRQGRYRVIEDVVNPYDLTKDLLKDCLFSPKSRADILKILGIYRYTVENFNVSKIVAFASNVVVKARNYRGLLDEIYTHTGINFNITGDDEVVKDIYNAVNAKVDMPKGVCVYIMGYSTYIIRYNRRSAFDTFVVPYGYINLTQKYSKIEDMINFFKKELKGCSFVVNFEEEGIVGAGVPFLDVSKVAKKLLRYPIDIDNNYDLSAEGVKKVLEFAKDLDIEKVKKIKGLSFEGSDSVQGGLAIISAIFNFFGARNVVVTDADKAEGKILENLVGTPTEKYSDLVLNSLDNYYEFRKEGLFANYNVYTMAVLLFKQLKVVHKLSRNLIKPLKIASFMYDCGKFIDFKNYEKHGFYAIMNANIAGVSQKDILLAGFICQCQNLDNFNLPEILKYKEILDDEDVDAVRKLGVLVKLSVCLNFSRKGTIQDVICDILGDSIIMKTVVNGDPQLEIMQSMKLTDDFKKTFKKNLQII